MSQVTTVLLVEPNIEYPGNTGGSVHLMELSKELGEKVNLKVACDCGEDFEEDGVEFYNVDCGMFSLFSFRKLWRLSEDADIIHTRSDPFELAGPLIARMRGIPVVGEVNVNFLAYEKKHSVRDMFYHFFQLVKRSWLHLVTKRLDKVICVSNSIKQELLNQGFREKKLEVVHNGGNPERFEGLEQGAMREELDLPEDDYIVLLMGELGPRHGLEKIIDIDSEKVTFLVMGGIEKYREYLEELKEEAPENFIFRDPVPYSQIKKHVVASDITVAPYQESDNSHEFGFCPIKILDSMAAGRPVVASDTPWIREILSDQEGVVTDDLEEGIMELSDPEKRNKKSQKAIEKVKSSLSWRHTAEKIHEVYRGLI